MGGDIPRPSYAAMAAVCCCAYLAACSQDAGPALSGVAAAHVKSSAPVRKKGPTVEQLTTGMSSAPALGKSALPADLKFELGQRPKIGQSLEINLALIPKADGGPARVQVSGADGLDTTQGDNDFEVAEVQEGMVYRHTLHVTPTTDGVLLVNVTVALKHDETSDSQVFTLPVIVDR